MKKRNNNLSKITVLFLVSIMALAGAGIAYSMWTQELQITGTISSGEVLVGIYDYRTLDSGPNFLENGGNLYPQDSPTDGTVDLNELPGDNSEGKNVASHNSFNDGTFMCVKDVDGISYDFVDSITEIIDNVYPWYRSGTELWIGNGGTIPVKISDINFEFNSGNSVLMDYLVFDTWGVKLWDYDSWVDIGSDVGYDSLIRTLLCYQLEPCQTLSIYFEFYFIEEVTYGDAEPVLLPQNNDVSFDITVTVAQWNEVPCNIPPTPLGYASIADYVWEDLNQNGIQDPGEPGIAGVIVNLHRVGNTLIDTKITDENGFYIFTGLLPDTYQLEFILPEGYVFTFQDQGSDDDADSDVDPSTGWTAPTTLEAGENDATWDVGLYQTQTNGDQGCSHGLWKQSQYFDEWTDYTTDQILDSVFAFPTSLSELADDTFIEALTYGGGSGITGKAKILLRNAVASLLNAAHPDVNYPLTQAEIITQVSNALLSENETEMTNLETTLDTYNNLHNCDLCPS